MRQNILSGCGQNMKEHWLKKCAPLSFPSIPTGLIIDRQRPRFIFASSKRLLKTKTLTKLVFEIDKVLIQDLIASIQFSLCWVLKPANQNMESAGRFT